MTILYGIKNCDTVKKTRKWLDRHGVDYHFHDVRAEGLSAKQLKQWSNALGWEALLNRRSTSWRQLPDHDKVNLNEGKALTIMQSQPAIIKRPILEINNQYYLGFKEAEYKKLFK